AERALSDRRTPRRKCLHRRQCYNYHIYYCNCGIYVNHMAGSSILCRKSFYFLILQKEILSKNIELKLLIYRCLRCYHSALACHLLNVQFHAIDRSFKGKLIRGKI